MLFQELFINSHLLKCFMFLGISCMVIKIKMSTPLATTQSRSILVFTSPPLGDIIINCKK